MPMTISIDDELKQQFTDVCQEIGLTPSAAFTVFAKTVVRLGGIPFELNVETIDLRTMRLARRLQEAQLRYEMELKAELEAAHARMEAGEYYTHEEFMELVRRRLESSKDHEDQE